MPLLPRRQRARRRGARRPRRPARLRLPPQAADRERHRPARGGAGRAGAGCRELLAGARQADDALGDADRGGPAGGGGRPRPRRRRGRGGGCEAAGRRGRAERQGERRADHAELLHQRPALRRRLGRELVPRRDARLARAPGPGRGARLRRLGALGGPAAAPRDGARDPPHQLAARRRFRGLLAPRGRDRHRRVRVPAVAAALGQRRGSDGVLPGGRARDQARVHRRPPGEPQGGGAAGGGGGRRHAGAGADLRRADPRRALGARLGGADGDRHRLRGGADRDDGGAGAGRAPDLPDRRGDRRRHRRDRRRGAVLLGRAAPGVLRGGRGRSSGCWRSSTAGMSTR